MRLPRNLEATTQLALGDRGVYEGKAFELVGRRCVQGPRGQIWNEWTLASDHEPPITLSESWGSFTMFREGSLLPSLDRLSVGLELPSRWLVVERGLARRVDVTEEPYEYADLSFRGDPPRRGSIVGEETFVGVPVQPTDLGLTLREDVPSLVPAPNVSIPAGVEQWLEVGEMGTIEGVTYRVLGMVARSSQDEEPSRWEDYLLYNARIGQRWLSVADGHWSFVSPVEPGPLMPCLLAEAMSGVPSRLDWATGELPWSAEIGEQSFSSERDDVVVEWNGTEISASRLHALEPEVIARAFGRRSLPRPR